MQRPLRFCLKLAFLNNCKVVVNNCPNKYLIAGIPKLYWFGSEGDYNIMALDFLGSNLEELIKEVGGKFSMLSALFVVD